jgi:hypothetical protein
MGEMRVTSLADLGESGCYTGPPAEGDSSYTRPTNTIVQ